MDTYRINAIGITVIVGVAALWIGLNAATAQLETIMWVSGVSTLITCALLGKKIWMIIPFAMALNVTLTIPGRPSTMLLAQGLFCGFSVLLIMLRRLPIKVRFNELDFWVLLITLFVFQAYLRNPVGLNIFGGDSVGARPYAIFVATLTTYFFLSHIQIPTADLKWLLRIHIIGGLLNFAVLSIGYFVPRVGIFVGSSSASSISSTNFQTGTYGVAVATRVGFLRDISNNIAIWVSAFKSPIKACFHPIWAPLILISFALAALSGFRNEIAAIGFTYFVAIAYRGGFPSIMIATTIMLVGIVGLAIINIASPLPANVQRSLSFLPGSWDTAIVKDAQDSTDWRVEMWIEALSTDHWIKNKALGDGLGMTREQLNYIQSFGSGFTLAQGASKYSKLSLQQEFMMATNDYHSGPVSTIRTIGYSGLAVFLTAMIRLAMHAHRVITRARNTTWFPLSLLVGIPIIWNPVFFTFLYADFGTSISSFLMGVAFVSILKNNLPSPDTDQVAVKSL